MVGLYYYIVLNIFIEFLLYDILRDDGDTTVINVWRRYAKRN